MFGKGLKLFTLFGFTVRVDWSWLIIAVLITWSLAEGLFPARAPGLDTTAYWIMGAVGALGLFASVVFHEFAHSLVARAEGLPMKGITLFIFGGVAQMEEEPQSARTEFLMTIVGPVSSLFLSGLSWLALQLGQAQGWPGAVLAVVGWLAFINLALALFNLVPAFPLDGGRVLRSALWAWKGDLRWATRIASAFGNGFGILLIGLGILRFISGDFIGGMWYFLIGSFLRNAAQLGYHQVLLRQALEGVPVRRIMVEDPVTVPAGITLSDLVDQYVYRTFHKMLPVVENGRLAGCITTREIREVPREEWGRVTVADVMSRCSRDNAVQPGADVMKVLSGMNRSGASRMMVTEGERLVGVITLKDIMRFLAVRLELEESAGAEDAESLAGLMPGEPDLDEREEGRGRPRRAAPFGQPGRHGA